MRTRPFECPVDVTHVSRRRGRNNGHIGELCRRLQIGALEISRFFIMQMQILCIFLNLPVNPCCVLRSADLLLLLLLIVFSHFSPPPLDEQVAGLLSIATLVVALLLLL